MFTAEIYKSWKNKKGVALIITILLMGLILFLSLYFLSFSLTEERIARSQSWGAKTYYLAEAGIAEMIWKLKNDPIYKDNFETNQNWTASFSRTNPFGPGSGTYTVAIANSNLANGEITATGAINVGNNISQRIVKVVVYKAMGSSAIRDSGAYANGNIDISTSKVNFYNGSAHSNNVFTINGSSVINVDSDINAVGNYIKNWQATVNIEGAIHAKNFPPEATYLQMPAVDFDSSSPNSYKNQANVKYTSAQFKTLIRNNPNLVLNNAITYVSGGVEFEDMQSLTINGLLVVKGEVEIEGSINSITINNTPGSPSGIIAYDDIEIEGAIGNLNIHGVLYSNDQMNITNIPSSAGSLNITGALVSRKLTITSVQEPLNITYDNDIVSESFPGTAFSPVVTIEHWEEEY